MQKLDARENNKMNGQIRLRNSVGSVSLLALLAALGVVLIYRQTVSHTPAVSDSAPPAPVAQLAPGTDSLLQQTAEHLSKMQGGDSIGGFPGFEPPEDDEKYRRKIENESYTGEEANYWLKEINNFLRQIIDKNPGMTLEKILQMHGATPAEVESFTIALQRAHYTANAMSDVGYGVSVETVSTFETLLKTLGVPLWPY